MENQIILKLKDHSSKEMAQFIDTAIQYLIASDVTELTDGKDVIANMFKLRDALNTAEALSSEAKEQKHIFASEL